MTVMSQAMLISDSGHELPLQRVNAKAELNGILCEVFVEQHYKNNNNTNIETSYSFPLPLDAVLLELEIELNGEVLKGVVQPKCLAEQSYEEAIEEGDSAILLSKISPGFYNVSLGNLLAHESAVIRIKYAQLLQWQVNQLRFYFPTTFTPGYGCIADESFELHQQPEHDLLAEYPFNFEVYIQGELASAPICSASHFISTCHVNNSTHVKLVGVGHSMDRDFILSIEKPEAYVGEAMVANDIDGYAYLASICPPEQKEYNSSTKQLQIVVDCSGSMIGESIEQAKLAVKHILMALAPEDKINIVLFGSSHRYLLPEMQFATQATIDELLEQVAMIQADMGGTEISAALQSVYKQTQNESDILLLTDGSIWDTNPVIEAAEQSQCRHFVVGIGNGVKESFLTQLARATDGEVEFISINENMAKRMVRHVNRIDQVRLNKVLVEWDSCISKSTKTTSSNVYSGDTCNQFAWSAEYFTNDVDYSYELNGKQHNYTLPVINHITHSTSTSVSTLARFAAHSKLTSLNDADAALLAEQYQLVTKHTSCILVAVREVKAENMPDFVDIKHQVPEGKFGVGRSESGVVMYSLGIEADFSSGGIFSSLFKEKVTPKTVQALEPSVTTYSSCNSSPNNELEYLDIPAFLKVKESAKAPTDEDQIEQWLTTINDDISLITFDELLEAGERQACIDLLVQLTDETLTDVVCIIAWLQVRGKFSNVSFSRQAKKVLKKLANECGVTKQHKSRVRKAMTLNIDNIDIFMSKKRSVANFLGIR